MQVEQEKGKNIFPHHGTRELPSSLTGPAQGKYQRLDHKELLREYHVLNGLD